MLLPTVIKWQRAKSAYRDFGETWQQVTMPGVRGLLLVSYCF